jgi:hypothetical protein
MMKTVTSQQKHRFFAGLHSFDWAFRDVVPHRTAFLLDEKALFEKLSLVSYVKFPFINITRCRAR